MTDLQIYITEECWSCDESRRLADTVRREYPEIGVHLVDLMSSERPDHVFAAPTFLLDGRVISLGNPRWTELAAELERALSLSRSHTEQF